MPRSSIQKLKNSQQESPSRSKIKNINRTTTTTKKNKHIKAEEEYLEIFQLFAMELNQLTKRNVQRSTRTKKICALWKNLKTKTTMLLITKNDNQKRSLWCRWLLNHRQQTALDWTAKFPKCVWNWFRNYTKFHIFQKNNTAHLGKMFYYYCFWV